MSTLLETNERRTKRRAAMSCDRCKTRKTKVNAPCHLDPSRRRQRPYYRVSEEEFRYMTQIIEHFMPDTELNLQTLKSYVAGLDNNVVESPPTPTASDVQAVSPVCQGATPEIPAEQPSANDSAIIDEEISGVYSDVGRLRVDSRGVQRYVGESSSYLFHSAVRLLKRPRQPDAPKSQILAPLTATEVVPPPTPEASLGVKYTPRQINLPYRELCNRCIGRFFRDVHSIYWFFSAEQLHTTLDRIYSGDATAATPATLCSLYSILALTCESETQNEWSNTSMRPSVTYLTLAKALVPTLCDDADTDSIRALCLLGLSLSCSMFGNTAYIYVGSAARIAFTLGLHARDAVESGHGVQEQVNVRLFCSLYLLDLDTALCYGNPPAIDEGIVRNLPKIPSEHILSPGSNMPLNYLETSCKLAKLRRGLTKLMYQKSASNSPRLSISSVSTAISGLGEFYANIPSHLRHYDKVAAFHERSVAVLHLRYWSAVMFATRPFLLYKVLHEKELNQSPKQKWFNEFGNMCIDAAKKSLDIISFLRERELLSSLVVFDCGCILEDMQVFLLALADPDNSAHKLNVEACLYTLQGMEQIFWTKHALPEVTAQLEECGILNSENRINPTNPQPHDLVFLDFTQNTESYVQKFRWLVLN
ncbi:hypothetical protein EDB81DRAFT_934664 [Dactylonectria macrodidyma]|uniref:Xylanolytic transcriptional activator regulatory domain-containing protein n=1 Tax=Dactylonectria macrodidyma TaxID=307937 RepID=A0A9P9ESC5_9HYPO|nr:hypothetical protein EDB81DRAFT_934664 [Dactylonectria macrodidyma]